MSTQNESRAIATRFFHAWSSKDESTVRSLMAYDIAFESPTRASKGADALLMPIMKFGASLRSAELIDLIADGDRAAILFDANMAEPVGTVKTVWLLNLKGGKIQALRSVFDATEVRKVLGGPQKG